MQYYTNPHKVFVTSAHERDIKKQIEILNKQGQIVPLMAHKITDTTSSILYTINYDESPYGDALVMAARRLNWPTILVETEVRDS